MYGKLFTSTFTGSMFGAGADVFAVWAYVVAHTVESSVELNPKVLAATLGMDADRVRTAIEWLSQPDTESRNPAEGGRRIIHEGGFQYRVVSHTLYRSLKSEVDRREYNREAKRKSRARKSNDLSMTSTVSTRMSAHTEAEADTEAVRTPVPQVQPLVARPQTAISVSEEDRKRQEVWQNIIGAVEIPAHRVKQYLVPAHIRQMTGDHIEVNCARATDMRWISDNYRQALAEAAKKVYPGSNFRFTFVCKPLSRRGVA
jgi:hypothetical protein